MPKRARATHPVSIRIPETIYSDLAALAQARGIDISAILNWIIADYHPTLKLKTNPSASLSSGPGTGEALRIVGALLTQLQETYEALSRRAREEGERRAA
jgi:hypothetical protein